MEHKPNMYVVGGAVRSILLGENPRDIDYVAVGFTAQQLIDDGFQPVDAEFPVFIDPRDNSEVALARREKSTGKGYKDFTTDTSDVTLEEDLKRRDLTINAMAIDSDKNIIDPFGGQEDLQRRILRHTSEAFFEDSVRVLRLARFQAKYPSFRIHESTIDLIREHKDRLLHLTPERIYKEMYKAMETNHPSLYFKTLDFLGVLSIVHPELQAMKECIQKPTHHFESDVFQHSMMVLEECCKITQDIPTRFGALYHDIAKPISDVKKQGFHKGHDGINLVQPLVDDLKARYRLPNIVTKKILQGALYHMKLHKLKDMNSSTIASMFNDKYFPKNKKDFIDLLCISTADSRGRITIGYKKEEINADAMISTFNAIKAYSPQNEILEYNERHKEEGKTAHPDLIKQMIHRYSIKCVDAWLKPALDFVNTTRTIYSQSTYNA